MATAVVGAVAAVVGARLTVTVVTREAAVAMATAAAA